jgi:hypothetical protein
VQSATSPRSRRDRAAAILANPLVRTLARRLPRWRGVVVLNYHRIGEATGQPWDRTLWNVDADTFDVQLATLARDAEVVAPEDVLRYARESSRGRRVLVTFDDGYRDNYEIAFPLLRRHGLPATFFPATGFIDGARPAWWDELAWMVSHARHGEIPAGGLLTRPLPLGPERDGTVRALTDHYKSLAEPDAEPFLERVAEATGAGRCAPSSAATLWMT